MPVYIRSVLVVCNVVEEPSYAELRRNGRSSRRRRYRKVHPVQNHGRPARDSE
jgi:hypothetical protein